MSHQPPPYQNYGPYQGRPNDSNTLSIVGIVLGCVAFLFCPPGFGIAGIVCGVVAKNKNERLANTAIGVSIAGLIIGMILGVVVFRGMYGG
ncbi:DUF4190 domain-containing protein [Streptomyces sp. P38-E01]|uniref:DUF4190 domain-containing protein n=1 Tax=Streptomyces tardus TaxID=2780544 RepID=A0A949N7W6_9ACTN|nr:DUF4190 domain-containing protein [Streptomyces tardus]MBU7597891.1 DUF4190 domain-containing protein [Streptomyces tardus]